jgi:hypothetical protein
MTVTMRGLAGRMLVGVGAALVAACAPLPPADGGAGSPGAADSAAAAASAADWKAVPLPGKASTQYRPVSVDGRRAIHARAERSASMWRQQLRVRPQDLGRLTFSWKVPRLIEGADLSSSEADDTPVRVVLAFDGDHGRLSMRNRMLFDLAQALTGEAPPFATLMYVWEPKAAVGSVIRAPRTDRVRGLVVESGGQRLDQWLHYERDIVADFRQAYGEDPGELIGVAVMTDSDNTSSEIEAFYGGIELRGLTRRRLF